MSSLVAILRIYLRGVVRWLNTGTSESRAHVEQQTRFLTELLEGIDG